MKSRKLRIMCLHGYQTNGAILQHQMEGFQGTFQDEAEFIYLNAPNISTAPTYSPIVNAFGHLTPFREWYANGDESKDYVYACAEKSLQYVQEQFRALEPIDAILGFSQGTLMSTIFIALYLRRFGVAPCKLFISVCGVGVLRTRYQYLFENADGDRVGIPLPSIHLLSPQDTLYRDSEILWNMYAAKGQHVLGDRFRTRFEFDGGHRFPAYDKYASLYQEIYKQIYSILNSHPKKELTSAL